VGGATRNADNVARKGVILLGSLPGPVPRSPVRPAERDRAHADAGKTASSAATGSHFCCAKLWSGPSCRRGSTFLTPGCPACRRQAGVVGPDPRQAAGRPMLARSGVQAGDRFSGGSEGGIAGCRVPGAGRPRRAHWWRVQAAHAAAVRSLPGGRPGEDGDRLAAAYSVACSRAMGQRGGAVGGAMWRRGFAAIAPVTPCRWTMSGRAR